MSCNDGASFDKNIQCRDKIAESLHKKMVFNKDKFRVLIEHSADGVVVFSEDFNLLYFSPSVETLLVANDQIAEVTAFPKKLNLVDYALFLRYLRMSSENPGKPQKTQAVRIIHQDGNWRWIEGTLTNLLYNKSVGGIVFNFHDITQNKINEELLQHKELRLNQAQAIAHLGSWELDFATGIYYWSEEALRIHGLDTKQKRQSYETWINFIHPDDLDYVLTMTRDIETNLNELDFFYRIVREDGIIRTIHFQSQFEFNDKGNPIGLFGVVHDVTALKEYEVALKQSEADKTVMLSEIIQRNKNLEQFSFIISHNLRAPVANIIGLAKFLNEEGMSEGNRIINEALLLSTMKLDEVIIDLNTILTLRKASTDSKEEVNLADLVDAIKISITLIIATEEAEIKINFEELDTLFTLKSYLYSIFYNLILNSIKYRQPYVRPLVEISTLRRGDSVIIAFKDNGIGMDMRREGKHVFEIYSRFNHQTEGKGIGLFMVKTQVEALGGQINFQSEVNKGSLFEIIIPL